MSYEATVTSKGQVTIPKAVRERLNLEQGEKILFRFEEDGSVRLVAVPSDPMERLEAAQDRAAPYDLDASELIERERRDWGR
ncbi:AbrB/MazE/SpoVT family DNA-binding domain-containing protein [Natranaeroarchaeum aerophilus]|uniref:AbrB/MazE/SpoVT family DNA-binding domain-containing protein n=1 Tax=Natranaeroarchaeum aerophilus TaxID=2917711 RepID=A0AAE3FMC1_9EURY|nr:AbrB/MazE/SpoVT family DNA-binding domain-containing protein [Natranaeroarchaeum aerophilus]MCL9812093.1 AbrB/MazE/SpoVT family DNA-binding domain-containing protein [Natranaeroarchaeum aerophilus]